MNYLEIILFIGAVIGVIGIGIWKSKDPEDKNKEADASDYFLAGRGLTWWLVGFSLIAANISTEQFVGMTGGAADFQGLAISSWEWIAAITLVVVAFWFLPKFLRAGLYTIPEFLEYRFNPVSRLIMSVPAVITLVVVNTATVIYSGAKFVSEYYDGVAVLGSLEWMCLFIALFAAVYVFVGGLKACAWTDLIWGSALVVAGGVVLFAALGHLEQMDPNELIQTKVANSAATVEDLANAGGFERLILLNDGVDGEAVAVTGENGSGGKLHTIRPKDDPAMPWTALLIGIWIPNFFYWGLNQFIVQRTLGAKSLAEGQKGIVFAAFLKLLIPFIVVIPGILAFNLFSQELHEKTPVKNIAAFEKEADSQKVFTVDSGFVKHQPDLAAKVLKRNETSAGEATKIDLSKAYDPKDVADEINYLAKAAGKKDIGSAGLLSGYDYDAAFPVLVRELIKPHPYFSWFILAALCGAVISSLASMLNSASTMATMDLYSKVTGVTDARSLIKVGKVLVIIFVIIAASVAPFLDRMQSIFTFIQEFQGFISPGILAVFIFGFFSPKTPRYFGWAGILVSCVCYGLLLFLASDIAFLNRMAITVGVVFLSGIIATIVNPLSEPVKMPINEDMNLDSSKGAKVCGILVVILTIVLYIAFW